MKTASLLTSLLAAACAMTATAQVTSFTYSSRPLGVSITSQNEIMIHSDNTSGHGFTFFKSNGQKLGYMPAGGRNSGSTGSVVGDLTNRSIGGLADSEGLGRLVTVPWWNGVVLNQRNDGIILAYDRQANDVSPWVNLRLLQPDTRSIYDVAEGRFHSFGGQINPAGATYGDIAAYRGRHSRHGSYTALFITGLGHAQVFPFVMRVRIYDNGSYDAKIIMASSASTSGALNGYRGIAVNSSGRVATVLPYQTTAGAVDRLFTCSADFDESRRLLPQMMLGGMMLGGQGMTCDSNGNFYVATGKLGINGRSGALAIINSDCSRVTKIVPIGNSMMIDSADVAVSSDNKYAYVTIYQGGQVVRAQLK